MSDHAHAGHGHDGCAHAHDHARHAPLALANAETLCRQRGVRLTAIRRGVLEALYRTHRPLGAYDIVEMLGPQAHEGRRPRRLAPVTIYRALDFLMEQGFAHKLSSRNSYVACPHRHAPGDMVIFLICEHCGGVDEKSSRDIDAGLDAMTRREGFTPRARMIEIAGACAHCRGVSPAAA